MGLIIRLVPKLLPNGQVFETRRMELLRDIREVNAAIRAAELRKRPAPLALSIFGIEDI